jgi:fatty-acid desaturase
MLTTNQQQNIKFVIICLLSIVGIVLYQGTLLKAFLLFIVFAIIGRIANLTYHRWLAHNYIDPGPFGKIILLWSIVAFALAKPVSYVIGHRLHHKYSDTDKDPHCPKIGFWNCLVGNFNIPKNVSIPLRDILRKKEVMFVEKYFYLLYLINLAIFYTIDPDIVFLSFSLLNLRGWIAINIFNYVAHGGKKISSPQNLSAWTSLLYLGEQLHKNHHDNPSSSNFGVVSKYNFDILYLVFKRLVKVR